uniref:Cytochrome P450 n=1 Tax=Bionectria ochroleuca TaxID=29856 RepID=A0A8H7NBW0_BIOOC
MAHDLIVTFMPIFRPHVQLQKWAKKYGPIYSLVLGTKVMIVLSSDDAVSDVLVKKSGNYSDRPDMFIGQKIASGNLRLVVMRYGDNWRMIHRMIHNIMNIKAAVTYVPYQDLENKFLLEGLLDTPADFLAHIRRFTYSLSTQMIFGYRCVNNRDPNLLQLFESFEKWGKLAGSSSAQIADLFPVLQKLPDFMTPNVSYAKKLFEIERKNYVGHWMRSKKALDSGKGLPCFCNDIYRVQSQEGFSDDAAGYISGSLLEAGSDTTASTLYGFIQAALVWPEVQERAQEEIDRVVGPSRLPTIDDYDNLPYIRCCIKESLRWMPTVILGVPHAAIKEDTYNGYVIPQGATVVNNVWAIHMDPERSESPRVFNPERFKGDDTSLYQSAAAASVKGFTLPNDLSFGDLPTDVGIQFRTTGGRQRSSSSIRHRRLGWGITVQPSDYPAIIKSRSPEKAQIIRDSVEECQQFLDPDTLQWKKVPEGMAFSTWMPDTAQD